MEEAARAAAAADVAAARAAAADEQQLDRRALRKRERHRLRRLVEHRHAVAPDGELARRADRRDGKGVRVGQALEVLRLAGFALVVLDEHPDVAGRPGRETGNREGNRFPGFDAGGRHDRRRRVERGGARRDRIGDGGRRSPLANADELRRHEDRRRAVLDGKNLQDRLGADGYRRDPDDHDARSAVAAGEALAVAGTAAAAAPAVLAVAAGGAVRIRAVAAAVRSGAAGTLAAVAATAAATAAIGDRDARDVVRHADAADAERLFLDAVARRVAVSAGAARAAAAAGGAGTGLAGRVALPFRAGLAGLPVARPAARTAGRVEVIVVPTGPSTAAEGGKKRRNRLAAERHRRIAAVGTGRGSRHAARAARADGNRVRPGLELQRLERDHTAAAAATADTAAAATAAAHEERAGRDVVRQRERAVRKERHDRGIVIKDGRRHAGSRRRDGGGH